MKSPRADSLPTQSVIDALGTVALPSDEIDAFITALQQRYRSVLRCRSDVIHQSFDFATESVDWYRLGRRVTQSDVKPSRYLAYATADYYLQDAGSLLALAACGADKPGADDSGERLSSGPLVCDLCAAPGGKATALLEAIGEQGFLLTNEPIRSRIAPLAYNLARTGSDRFAITSLDPEKLAEPLGGVFDLVVVDAPCSGQALMGRGKQSLSALSAKQIQHSAARQRRILAAAIRLLKAGGQLVYSTCTFAEAENELQIRQLIADGVAQADPIDSLQSYGSGESMYRLWPHRHACAGSFAASLRATSEVEQRDVRARRKRIEKMPFDLSQWYHVRDQPRLKSADSVVYAWPEDSPSWVEELAITGPEVAHRTGQTWKPSHAAALRRATNLVAQQFIDVDASLAKQFLSGSPIPCDQAGWQVVRFDSKPLGWIKGTGGTGKNQLPAAARIAGEIC